MDSTSYNLPFPAIPFWPLDAQSHRKVRMATQKSCSYAKKKGIRESHALREKIGRNG
jgi:hypothetical protein